MKKSTKILTFSAALGICFGMSVSANAFSDMPDGEMGKALQNAVNAGLINGVTDDSIAPNDNITRAQMATIIVRAFNATENSDTKYNDITDQWYAEYVSKASAMGAFQGDDDNNFNPENNITFQETYAVLSRMFGFEPYTQNRTDGTSELIGGAVSDEYLNSFSDKEQIADWAKNYAKYMVKYGGYTGIDGKLNPTKQVTRGEFAMIMDELVASYIDQPGTYTKLPGDLSMEKPDGLIMVRCGGVSIDGLNTDKNLVITYGVDEKGCKVMNSTVNGTTLVLGGEDKEYISSGKTTQQKSYVSIQGQFYDVRVKGEGVYLDASGAKMANYYGAKGTFVSLPVIQ